MIKKASLIYIAVSTPIMLVSFFLAHPAASILFSVFAVPFPVALIIIGAARDGKIGPLKIPLALLFLVLEGSLIAMVVLRNGVMDNPWILGFPASAAVQIYIMWLVPLVLVSLAYALTFNNFSLKEEDLEELKSLKKSITESDIGGEF